MKRTYPHLVQPEEYPEFTQRWAKATTRAALDNTVQFATLRRFTEEENKLTDIREKLDLYTREIEMGKVVWPFVSTLLCSNFDELVAEIKKRGLFLFDFWGYVPGTNTAGQSWGQYRVPYRVLELLKRELGDRFLGMDNGEQDGRYIGAYAHMMYPDHQQGPRQYLNFHDYFAQLGDDMGHFITVLCSLNYGHYFAKMGDHIMLGAETARRSRITTSGTHISEGLVVSMDYSGSETHRSGIGSDGKITAPRETKAPIRNTDQKAARASDSSVDSCTPNIRTIAQFSVTSRGGSTPMNSRAIRKKRSFQNRHPSERCNTVAWNS